MIIAMSDAQSWNHRLLMLMSPSSVSRLKGHLLSTRRLKPPLYARDVHVVCRPASWHTRRGHRHAQPVAQLEAIEAPSEGVIDGLLQGVSVVKRSPDASSSARLAMG